MQAGEDLQPSEPRAEETAPAATGAVRLVWLAAGIALTGIGIVGLVLPVMPGTIFLILAAACFARGSPRLERWLLHHPRLGPSVLAWRQDGAIPRKGKVAAFAGMALSIVLVSLSGAPPIAIASTVALVLAGAAYVGTRPTR